MSANEHFVKYHNGFDRSSTLWRYMDLQKFILLLHSSSIWFSRADRFDDPFEGAISEVTRRYSTYGPDVTPKMIEDFVKINSLWKQWTFVSCWHLSSRENALMWSSYAKNGVAIKTSFNNLSSNLSENTFLAPVIYKNFETEHVPQGSQIQYFVKRHFFSDESEVRCLIVDPPYNIEYDGFQAPPTNLEHGRAISVDLHSLIEAVIVRPFAPKEEVEAVKAIVKSFGFDIPVVQSSLDGNPIFIL